MWIGRPLYFQLFPLSSDTKQELRCICCRLCISCIKTISGQTVSRFNFWITKLLYRPTRVTVGLIRSFRTGLHSGRQTQSRPMYTSIVIANDHVDFISDTGCYDLQNSRILCDSVWLVFGAPRCIWFVKLSFGCGLDCTGSVEESVIARPFTLTVSVNCYQWFLDGRSCLWDKTN